jgi:hypothetical protein
MIDIEKAIGEAAPEVIEQGEALPLEDQKGHWLLLKARLSRGFS